MIRTGIGFDIHRLAEGRRLVLGGVEIPHRFGLDGGRGEGIGVLATAALYRNNRRT
jgi:hypothetical protein